MNAAASAVYSRPTVSINYTEIRYAFELAARCFDNNSLTSQVSALYTAQVCGGVGGEWKPLPLPSFRDSLRTSELWEPL